MEKLALYGLTMPKPTPHEYFPKILGWIIAVILPGAVIRIFEPSQPVVVALSLLILIVSVLAFRWAFNLLAQMAEGRTDQ